MADLIPRGTEVTTPELTPRGTDVTFKGGAKGYLKDPAEDQRAYDEAQRRLELRPKGRLGKVLDVIDRGADNYAFNVSRPINGIREALSPEEGGYQYGKAIDRYYDEGISEAAGIPGTVAGVAGSIASPSPMGKAKLGYKMAEGAITSGIESLNQSTETDSAGRDAAISALTGGAVTGAVDKLHDVARPLEETEQIGRGEQISELLGTARKDLGVTGNNESAGLDFAQAWKDDALGIKTKKGKETIKGNPPLAKLLKDGTIPGSVVADELFTLSSRSGKKNAARVAQTIRDTVGEDAESLTALRAGMIGKLLSGKDPAKTQTTVQNFLDNNQELVDVLFTPEQAEALSKLNVAMGNAIQPGTPEANKFTELVSTVLGSKQAGEMVTKMLSSRQGASALITGAGGAAIGGGIGGVAGAIAGPIMMKAVTSALSYRPVKAAVEGATSRPVGVGREVAAEAPEALVGTPNYTSEEELRRHHMQQLLGGQ